MSSTLVLTRGQLRPCIDLPVLAEEMRLALTVTPDDPDERARPARASSGLG